MRVLNAACLRTHVQRNLRGDHEYVPRDLFHRRRIHDNARGICVLVSIRDKFLPIILTYISQALRSLSWFDYLFVNYIIVYNITCIFFISWLYTEHRKDRMLKDQKEPEAMINHKNEETMDHSLKNPRIIDTQKSTQKAEMMNGIDNAAFESEQLWSHDLRDPFFNVWRRMIH